MFKKLINLLITIILILLIIFVVGAVIFKFTPLGEKFKGNNQSNLSIPDNIFTHNVEEITPEPEETFSKLTISSTGDIMCHNTQFNDANKNGSYDFSYVFENIKPYIENTDLAIGNLETTFAGNGKYSGYPQFNTPEVLATNLKDLGFDVLTTSNNHSLDTGYNGLSKTLDFLDEVEMLHTGTSRSEEEQNKPLIVEKNGFKIAIVSFTYGTNGIPVPSGKPYCINLIDNDLILKQLEIAKNENPDLIIACMHWGIEYRRTPEQSQIDMSDFLFQNGVDVILGNHPHVAEPMELRQVTMPDGTEKQCFVIYSHGNFISGQTQPHTKTSIILNLEFSKSSKTNKVTIDNVSYTPIYMYTYPKFKNYKLLDIKTEVEKYDNNEDGKVGQETYNTLKAELEDMQKMYENFN